MPLITNIHVQSFRRHQDYSLPILPNTTVVTGPNGSGKTSLIEALYICLQGSSFKGSDKDALQYEAPWYRIDVTLSDDTIRTVKFEPERQTGKKQFIINGKTYYRLPAQYKFPIVLFEPDDLRLLHGSPARRRYFIDHFISQLDPEYAVAIRRYDRSLRQRNALLKQPGATSDDLFAWNVSLSEYGAYIITKRIEFTHELNLQLGDIYETIAHKNDTIHIEYSQQLHSNIKQKLLSELHAHTEKDRHLGFTSVGPHRHDIYVSFNASSAMAAASRGEMRTIILAMKFAEVNIIEATTGNKPIILLDDVFSELDAQRQMSLTTKFKSHQTIITSVSAILHDETAIDVSD